jgi:hypothetical protein
MAPGANKLATEYGNLYDTWKAVLDGYEDDPPTKTEEELLAASKVLVEGIKDLDDGIINEYFSYFKNTTFSTWWDKLRDILGL